MISNHIEIDRIMPPGLVINSFRLNYLRNSPAGDTLYLLPAGKAGEGGSRCFCGTAKSASGKHGIFSQAYMTRANQMFVCSVPLRNRLASFLCCALPALRASTAPTQPL